ncbi:pyridoxamine 5'-phosphate oxidase family protein [Pseudovibrio exalbescens]|uniref:pyridoxamine 5'-phosphate oxidase family protein n=1 Tax=Pseudovibrio exalbescens TaxID=197461 RepID=UPI002365D677|nr:pyridoxamine 5'-phosphate oxidase family protein [Pseudovibrio exalbescens]MDD7910309.1 pyridoxamine 5'-phosphate oxidase family protein [Pseudovibrio exalbescens]MDX5594024.1 pyridoxamine 5'-phosphate oxidase family protein [Pseudovibrio sp. SPO723]
MSTRADYDWETIASILDTALVAHVGFIDDGRPMVIPMAFGRMDRRLFIHGAKAARIVKGVDEGAPVSLTVTHVDGIVCARSAFHNSFNYRSVVLHGTAHPVTDTEEKLAALRAITNHILPDRWDELRPLTPKELKATGVWAFDTEHAAAKMRQGPPIDEPEDYALPNWAGIIPVTTALGLPVTDGTVKEGVPVTASTLKARQKFV